MDEKLRTGQLTLLHPYRGNVSTIGDCLKLAESTCIERKAVVVIGYEHNPAKIDLTPLIEAFEVVAKEVALIKLSSRFECRRQDLVHPVHRCCPVFGWEVMGVIG